MCEPVAHCSTAVNPNAGSHGGGVKRGRCGSSRVNANKYWNFEMIMDMRTFNGVTNYYVRWKGRQYKDSWLPIECFKDRQVVYNFEKNYDLMKRAARKGSPSPAPSSKSKTGKVKPTSAAGKGKVPPTTSATRRCVKTRSAAKKDEVAPTATARKKNASPSSGTKVPVVPRRPSPCSGSTRTAHDELEKILCRYGTGEEVQYVVKYRGEKEHHVVPAAEIHAKFPQVALAFYLEEST